MSKLVKYVEEENAFIAKRILKTYGRKPLAGELIDLNSPGSRARLKAHFEFLLEDEVLHQDGERPLAEALKEGRRLTALLNELTTYDERRHNGDSTPIRKRTVNRKRNSK